MRTNELGSSSLQSMFAAHHAQEAAEHGEIQSCDCPPGICLGEAEPIAPGANEAFFSAIEDAVIDIVLGDEDDYDPRQAQLEQLGDIIEDVVGLTKLYAAMVDEDRDGF